MRLFIVSYHKSGTHQIMPMFLIIPDVVDRSWNDWINVPERYGLNREINPPGIKETCENLRKFKGGANRAFGHLSYLPEYAKVFEETDTKVLFNIRDPRDIIVAEYENARRRMREKKKGVLPLHNFLDKEDGKFLFEKDDPITELIIFAHARWPRWLGWLDHDFVMPVRYEDLRLRTRETVEKIHGWLGGKECNPIGKMVESARPVGSNPTFRKGAVGEWKTTFEPHHVELAEELLKDIIEKLGYKW
jgi:hypothetical protein